MYIASNGWTNIAFNHVTVDAVNVYSSSDDSGAKDQSETVNLQNRLGEHTYEAGDVSTVDCSDMSGNWSEQVTGKIVASAEGMTQSDNLNAVRSINAIQANCQVTLNYDDSGIQYTRYGTIDGNSLQINGPGFGEAKESDIVDWILGGSLPGATITFTEDEFSGSGTITNSSVRINGTGVLNGRVTYRGVSVDFEANYTENSTLTQSNYGLSASSEFQQTTVLRSIPNALIEQVAQTLNGSIHGGLIGE